MPPKEKSKELKHRNIICLKLTDIELEILNQAASSVGISRSEYLRRLFLNRPKIRAEKIRRDQQKNHCRWIETKCHNVSDAEAGTPKCHRRMQLAF